MNKIDLFYGFLIGIAAALLGIFIFNIFISLYTGYGTGFIQGIKTLKSQGQLGKLITLGALFDLAAFFILLKLRKELMARGVILATLTLTVITLFV